VEADLALDSMPTPSLPGPGSKGRAGEWLSPVLILAAFVAPAEDRIVAVVRDAAGLTGPSCDDLSVYAGRGKRPLG